MVSVVGSEPMSPLSKALEPSEVCHIQLRKRQDPFPADEAASKYHCSPGPAHTPEARPQAHSSGLGDNEHHPQIGERILLVPDIVPFTIHPLNTESACQFL